MFTDTTHDAKLIFEVVELSDPEPLESIKINFQDLAEVQEARNPKIETFRLLNLDECKGIPQTNVIKAILKGTQEVKPQKTMEYK